MRRLPFLILSLTFFAGCSGGGGGGKDAGPRSFSQSDYDQLATLNAQQNSIYDGAHEAFAQPLQDGTSSADDSKQKIIESIKDANCVQFNIPLPPMTRQSWDASWIIGTNNGAGSTGGECVIKLFHEWTYDNSFRTLTIYKTYKPQTVDIQRIAPIGQIITNGKFTARQAGPVVDVSGSVYVQVDSSTQVYKASVTTDQHYENSAGKGRLDITFTQGVPAVTASLRWEAEFSDPPMFQYILNGEEVPRKKFQDAFSAYDLEEMAIQSSRIRF